MKTVKNKIKLKDVYSNDRNNAFWAYVRSIPEYKEYQDKIKDILKTKQK